MADDPTTTPFEVEVRRCTDDVHAVIATWQGRDEMAVATALSKAFAAWVVTMVGGHPDTAGRAIALVELPRRLLAETINALHGTAPGPKH